MSKLKLVGGGLAASVIGFTMNGCFAPQPKPECTVISTQEAYVGITAYGGLLEKQGTSTGANCAAAPSSDLTYMNIGAVRFAARGAPFTDWRIYLRPGYLADVYFGDVFSANTDTSNDCSVTTAPGKCVYCVTGTSPNLTLQDGGAVVDPAPSADGGPQGLPLVPTVDGGIARVNLSNRCGVTEESVPRQDPADPDGEKINAIGQLATQFPDDRGVCRLSTVTVASQDFAAAGPFPATQVRAEFTNVEIISTTRAPATYWTADLKMTEGDCVTNYRVNAFWPLHSCESDADCETSADLDAGRVFGSGLSPAFEPRCDLDLEICVPTVGADALKD